MIIDFGLAELDPRYLQKLDLRMKDIRNEHPQYER